jgi:hypothetical protein
LYVYNLTFLSIYQFILDHKKGCVTPQEGATPTLGKAEIDDEVWMQAHSAARLRRPSGPQTKVTVLYASIHLYLELVSHLDLVLGAAWWKIHAPCVCLDLHGFLHHHSHRHTVPKKGRNSASKSTHFFLRFVLYLCLWLLSHPCKRA